jgi:hypothetical protein
MIARTCGCVLLLLTVAFVGSTVNAQTKDNTKAQPASQEEMMKRWQEAATPGEAHKVLSAMLGSWESNASAWMAGPDQPPTVSKGSSVNSSVLDGRFIKQEFSGDMMGMPMLGIGYTGYDNIKKEYVGVWIDNTSTAMYTLQGSLDKSGKVLTMLGTMDDPMTGERNKKVKYITTFVDADNHVFEMHDLSVKAKNQKVVEIKYTRKKS